MGIYKTMATCVALLMMQGCASSSVQQGAAYGAIAGITTGAALGYSISEEDLLGSSEEEGGDSTDMTIDGTEAIVSGALIGAVVGAVVGGMVGHKMERPNNIYLEAQAAAEAEESDADISDEELGLDDDELGLGDDTLGPRRF